MKLSSNTQTKAEYIPGSDERYKFTACQGEVPAFGERRPEKERDKETSFDYFACPGEVPNFNYFWTYNSGRRRRARYYNSKLGFWNSVDPLAEKYFGWSPYNYTGCNPLSRIDPTGMAWFVNNKTGELRFIRGASTVDDDEEGVWENIGEDDLFEQVMLNETYVKVTDYDNISIGNTDEARLNMFNIGMVLVSEQLVEERTAKTEFFEDMFNSNSVTVTSKSALESKWRYLRSKAITTATEFEKQNIFDAHGTEITKKMIRYQDKIKLGAKMLHPRRDRSGYINSMEISNIALKIINWIIN